MLGLYNLIIQGGCLVSCVAKSSCLVKGTGKKEGKMNQTNIGQLFLGLRMRATSNKEDRKRIFRHIRKINKTETQRFPWVHKVVLPEEVFTTTGSLTKVLGKYQNDTLYINRNDFPNSAIANVAIENARKAGGRFVVSSRDVTTGTWTSKAINNNITNKTNGAAPKNTETLVAV